MYSERASFYYSRAISDLKVVFKEKQIEVPNDILVHLAMELVKAEQENERNRILESELKNLIEVIDNPDYKEFVFNVGAISSSIAELSESLGYQNMTINYKNDNSGDSYDGV
ncbi:hypothetical protein [Xylanimonas cellulosilytica]